MTNSERLALKGWPFSFERLEVSPTSPSLSAPSCGACRRERQQVGGEGWGEVGRHVVLLVLFVFAALPVFSLRPALAADAADQIITSHGVSAFGDLKYPADFKHFNYADPKALKGGLVALPDPEPRNTFTSLNPFVLRGIPAGGLDLLFDSLMVPSLDEPDAMYGLIAKSITYPTDRSWAIFDLRPEARFSDGSPLTAEDVVFTVETLQAKGLPQYQAMLRDVSSVEAMGPTRVKVVFSGDNRRDLPMVVAGLPIFSKTYYTTKKQFDLATLEPPLGSGPYLVEKAELGRTIQFRRNPDYWAKDLPVNVGRHNFDTIRIEYFPTRATELKALKRGFYDFRVEWTSSDWENEYDFSALKKGWVKRDTIRDHMPAGLQGLFLNTRRRKLQDIRVRKALTYAFDFERLNKTVFYGLYKRCLSIFENSRLAAEGSPSRDETELLTPFRDRLPPEVFGPAFSLPRTDGSRDNRQYLDQAAALLSEAGYTLQGGKLLGTDGNQLSIEFIVEGEASAKLLETYVGRLKALGIATVVRLVDAAEYQARMKTHDYDVVEARFTLGLTPGEELRQLFGSEAVDEPDQPNLAGIRNPAVDALIRDVITAKSRSELTTAARALDRAVMWNYYVVPEWYSGNYNVAYWDKFGRPRTMPTYFPHLNWVVRDLWWIDPRKQAALDLVHPLPQREPH